ncbi:hypothetical protein BaRGS_00026249 [Batillaria attramentaria]|uniref:Uncharacterized protein n=1 Tax=Batillaria attramentaria TaxID=370345 RepID=A0ABD0K612_9CAEN
MKSFLVVAPLNAILDPAMSKLGDAAVTLTEEKLKDLPQPVSPFAKRSLPGDVFFLVSHPEDILHKKSI